jgi:hypothetical protein
MNEFNYFVYDDKKYKFSEENIKQAIKDLDVSFGNHWNDTYEHNDLHRISTLSSDNVLNKSTLLFRRLLENESYKNYQ